MTELLWSGGGLVVGDRIYKNLEVHSLNCGPQMCGAPFLDSPHLRYSPLSSASGGLGLTAWVWPRQG